MFADSDRTQGLSGLSDCYFYLYDSSFTQLKRYNGYDQSFAPSTTGTYYLAIVRYSTSVSYPCMGGFYVYNNGVALTSLTPANTTLDLTLGEFYSLDYTYAPAEANVSFSQSYSNSSVLYYYGSPSPNSGSATASLRARRVGTATYRLYDSTTGIGNTTADNITVNITADTTTATALTVDDTASSTDADYEKGTVNDLTPYTLYSVAMTAGNTYVFQCADSENAQSTGLSLGDCDFTLYDSALNYIKYAESGNLNYTPTASGTYYLAITRRSSSGSGTAAIYVYTTD